MMNWNLSGRIYCCLVRSFFWDIQLHRLVTDVSILRVCPGTPRTFQKSAGLTCTVAEPRSLNVGVIQSKGKLKVKCTLVQAVRSIGGVQVQLHPFMTTALEEGEGSASRPGRFLPPGKTLYALYRRTEWAPGPVWTGAENLAPTGIRSSDRPAHSHSLYRLRYPDHIIQSTIPRIRVEELSNTTRNVSVSYFSQLIIRQQND